jgi:hypothetical protein
MLTKRCDYALQVSWSRLAKKAMAGPEMALLFLLLLSIGNR